MTDERPCPVCGEEYASVGQHMSASDCGPVRHVDVCEDDNCGVCDSWRQEKQEQARRRMTIADCQKTVQRKRRDGDQRTLEEVSG